MLLIGSHVSFTKDKQLLGCVEETLSYGANTFMFYTGAPQNTNRVSIDDELTKLAMEKMKEYHIDISNVIVHAPYIINIANKKDPSKFQFAVDFLIQELERCEQLGIRRMVLHPGSHVGLGIEQGLDNIVEALDLAFAQNTSKTIICLETMAGKGGEMGSDFQQFAMILKRLKYPERVQLCLDTCHLNDAGFDLENFDCLLEEIDRLIGIDKIGCIHVNDSKSKRGERKDRHENIGLGSIGFTTLLHIIEHPKLTMVPKILETPYVSEKESDKERKYPPYKFEIAMIKEQRMDENLLEEIRTYYKKER